MGGFQEYSLALPSSEKQGEAANSTTYTLRVAHVSLPKGWSEFIKVWQQSSLQNDFFVVDARWIADIRILQAAALKALNDKFESNSMRTGSLHEQIKYNISPQKGVGRYDSVLVPEGDTERVVIASLKPASQEVDSESFQAFVVENSAVVALLDVAKLGPMCSQEFLREKYNIGEKEAELGEIWKAALRRVACKEC